MCSMQNPSKTFFIQSPACPTMYSHHLTSFGPSLSYLDMLNGTLPLLLIAPINHG